MERLINLRFENKVVLVTGSSTGIGRATAIEFAEEGAIVIVNCLKNIDKAKMVVGEIEKSGGKAYFVKCNIADEKQVVGMVNKIVGKSGRIDILINNAGITKQSQFLELTLAGFQKTLDTNLLGTFLCLKG